VRFLSLYVPFAVTETTCQIHSTLAYYWDHKETLDADSEQRLHWATQAQQEAGEPPLVAKLRGQGLLNVIKLSNLSQTSEVLESDFAREMA
jgi:hypothetical protein